MAGTDPVAVDLTAVRMMGFEPADIRLLARAAAEHRFPLGSVDSILLRTNWDDWKDGIAAEKSLRFLPPNHWDSIVAWRDG